MGKLGRSGKGATAYVGLVAFRRLISLFVAIPAGRLLGADGLGQIAIAGSLTAVLAIGFGTCLEVLVVRAGVLSDAKAMHRYSFMLLVVSPLVSVAMGALAWGLGATILSLSQMQVVVVLITAGLSPSMTGLLTPLLRSQERFKAFVGVNLILIAVDLLAKVLLVFVWKLGVTGWILSTLLATFAAYVMAWSFAGRLERRGWSETLRQQVALAPHYLAAWTLTQSDRLIVARFSGVFDAGLYSAGALIGGLYQTVMTEVSAALMPRYVERGELADVTRLAVLQTRLGAWLAAGAALAGPLVLTWMFPGDLSSARSLVPVIIVAQFIYVVYVVSANALGGSAGETGVLWKASTVGAFALVASAIPLTALLSYWGTAIGVAIGNSSMAIVSIWMQRKSSSQVNWRALLTDWIILLGLVAAVLAGGVWFALG